MNMKKRTASLLIAAACLLSVGCASKDSSSQKDSSSEVTTSQTTAATTATTPAPAPEPELNGSYMKNYEGVSLNGQVAAMFRGKDGTVALQCNNEKRETSIYVFDAVSGKIVRTIKTVNPYDKLLGVFKDGSIITQKAGEMTFYRYYEGSDTPKKIEPDFDGVAIFEFDAENECIYAAGQTKDEMVKISLNDNKTTTIKYDGVYSFGTLISGTNLICTSCYDKSGTKELTSVFSLDTKKQVLTTFNNNDYLYCAKDTICETERVYMQGTDSDVKINTYSIKGKKYLCTYSIPNESMIFVECSADKDSDKLFVSVEKQMPAGTDIEKLSVIDLTNGKMANLDSLLNENTVTAKSCTVGTRGYWLVALTDKVNNTSTTRLVLLDPAKCSYDAELKKEVIDYENNNIIKCGQGLNNVRAEADKLEQKYNVRILIGNEINNLERTDITSTEDNPDITNEMLSDSLKQLDKELARYPKGFFDKFKTNGSGGLTIAIVESHVGVNESNGAAGKTGYSSGRYTVTINREYISYALHHELWHSVDYLLENTGKKIDEKQWSALNPSDFRYLCLSSELSNANDTNTLSNVKYRENIDYNIPYFVRQYSFLDELEDRATVIEEVYRWAFESDYKDPKEAYAELCKYTHIKAKIDFLAQASKEVFGYVYWEEIIKSAPLNS